MSPIRDKLKDASKSKLGLRTDSTQDHPPVDDYADGSFKKVPIDLIKPNPDQPRKIFDQERLAELSYSIKNKGILQPVLIRIDEGKNFFLVAGERRLRAAKMAGLETIPCIITRGKPAEIALIENLQREDLKPIEEAEALARMIDEYNYTQDQLAQVINKAKSTISETLSLNKLPAEIKDEVRRAEHYPRRLLVEIAKQQNSEKMIALFNRVKSGALKSDEVRQITRQPKEKTQRTPTAIALDRVLFLSNSLTKLDLHTAGENEKIEFLTALENLKKMIENKFL